MSATVESPNPAAENPLGPNAVLLLPRSTHEPIRALTNFAELVQHAINTAAKPAEVRPAYAAAFEAECLGCQIRLNGEELLLLADENAKRTAKLDRLHKGYCARHGCDSRFYRLTCNPAPAVDWRAILAIKDGYVSAPETDLTNSENEPPTPSNRKRHLLIASAAIALLAFLAIAWQLYTGGTIPLLRQPEQFQVDTFPDPLLGAQ